MSKEFALLYEIVVPRTVSDGQTYYRVSGDGERIPLDLKYAELAEYDAYRQVTEQVLLAEEVGFDCAWFVEHHFLEEQSHCSAPEVYMAYLAAKTKTIELGHGVRLLPSGYNHPLRVAEQGAVLDLISNGRLHLGTGRSATRLEMEGFGVRPEETRGQWEEAVDVVIGSWTEDIFEHEGKYFKIPPRAVIPKPLQKPHPPVWVASTSADGHSLAGEKGLGLLSFTIMLDLEELGNRVQLYRDGLKHARPAGKFVNGRAGVYTYVHCAETREEARKNVQEYFPFLKRYMEYTMGLVRWINPEEETYKHRQGIYEDFTENMSLDLMIDKNMVIFGDPDECVEKCKAYFELGADQLICAMQIKGIPHDKVMKSIKLFGKHVIPYFV